MSDRKTEALEALVGLEALYQKIRATNVRSRGLKWQIHEGWCSDFRRDLTTLQEALSDTQEEQDEHSTSLSSD